MIGGMIFKRALSPTLLAGIAVWGSALALYLATLAPSLTWGYNDTGVDGGELLAAANTFGVPHPPGYPTYTLLLRLFATVVPIGDFAHRGNLMSAVLGSVSVALLYLVILQLGKSLRPEGAEVVRIGSAVVGATVFAAAPLFWAQAVMTEVYTLNTVFVGALLLIATLVVTRREHLPARRTRQAMALFGLLLGLGLGNHLTLLAVAVPLLVWLGVRIGWRNVASAWSVGALALGLGIYLYLPISAARNPPVNWGGADTLGGIAWMLTGRAYQDYLFGAPLRSIPGQILDLIALVFTQLNPLGIFLGLTALAPLWARDRWFLAMSLLSIVALGGYSLSYFTVDSEVITIPAFMLLSMWAGIGFQWVALALSDWVTGSSFGKRGALPRRLPALGLVLIAIAALPAASVALNYGAQDLGDDTRALEYARGVMELVPDGSTVLSSEEGPAFSMWYMRYVEASERDVLPVAVPLLQFEWYWADLREAYPSRVPPEIATDLGVAVRRFIAHNDGTSGVYMTYRDFSLSAEFEVTQLGGVYEIRSRRAE